MTRDELIAELLKFPNAIVRIVWEGTVNEIKPDKLYMSKDGVLLIDANRLGDDKERFTSGEENAMDHWSL